MISSVAGRSGLLEILSWARPHDSETERRFLSEFIDRVPGMQRDAFGNRYLRIGAAPIMWSCHVDTVSRAGGFQLVTEHDGIVGLVDGKPGQCLGADDGAGLWIMLNMIEAGRPGLYVFHRGEERGCLGSSWIAKHNPTFLQGIKAAIAFDRAGLNDVITHQMNGRTCSDAFAKSMAAALNGLNSRFRYVPDDSGVYTDTNEYCWDVPECTNLSVGYYRQHGPCETLDADHCEALLEAMLQLDTAVLVIERDPAEQGPAHFVTGRDPDDDFAELVMDYPYLAARLLIEAGVSFDAFSDKADELERELARRWKEAA